MPCNQLYYKNSKLYKFKNLITPKGPLPHFYKNVSKRFRLPRNSISESYNKTRLTVPFYSYFKISETTNYLFEIRIIGDNDFNKRFLFLEVSHKYMK